MLELRATGVDEGMEFVVSFSDRVTDTVWIGVLAGSLTLRGRISGQERLLEAQQSLMVSPLLEVSDVAAIGLDSVDRCYGGVWEGPALSIGEYGRICCAMDPAQMDMRGFPGSTGDILQSVPADGLLWGLSRSRDNAWEKVRSIAEEQESGWISARAATCLWHLPIEEVPRFLSSTPVIVATPSATQVIPEIPDPSPVETEPRPERTEEPRQATTEVPDATTPSIIVVTKQPTSGSPPDVTPEPTSP